MSCSKQARTFGKLPDPMTIVLRIHISDAFPAISLFDSLIVTQSGSSGTGKNVVLLDSRSKFTTLREATSSALVEIRSGVYPRCPSSNRSKNNCSPRPVPDLPPSQKSSSQSGSGARLQLSSHSVARIWLDQIPEAARTA